MFCITLKTQQQWTFRSQICSSASMVAKMLQKSKFSLYVLHLCYIKFFFDYILHIYVICFIIYFIYDCCYAKFFLNEEDICVLMIRILSEKFYYLVFTRYLAGNIWSTISIQDIVKAELNCQINLIR